MKGWVYVLGLANGRYYVGSTNDLVRRLKEHESGRSAYTWVNRPVKLIFFQEYDALAKARKVERWLKRQKDARILDTIIRDGAIRWTPDR
jgi:predicted GIY-YIG superfamily endonuclease